MKSGKIKLNNETTTMNITNKWIKTLIKVRKNEWREKK